MHAFYSLTEGEYPAPCPPDAFRFQNSRLPALTCDTNTIKLFETQHPQMDDKLNGTTERHYPLALPTRPEVFRILDFSSPPLLRLGLLVLETRMGDTGGSLSSKMLTVSVVVVMV